MVNELTHALFAGAVMAVLNPLLGLSVIDWDVFLAGMVAMLLNLDRVETPTGKRSPVGHSLGFGLIWLYVIGCGSYLFCVLTDTSLIIGGLVTLAVAVGLFTHLLLDAITGGVFTFPKNLHPGTWLCSVHTRFDRFWGAWGRLTAFKEKRVRDSHVNIISLAILLMAIAVF